MSSTSSLRNALGVIMNVLVFLAIALTVGLVVGFFGTLAASSIGKMILSWTSMLTIPFGIDSIKTPYGGTFDADMALTIVTLLVIEWVLSIVRSRS